MSDNNEDRIVNHEDSTIYEKTNTESLIDELWNESSTEKKPAYATTPKKKKKQYDEEESYEGSTEVVDEQESNYEETAEEAQEGDNETLDIEALFEQEMNPEDENDNDEEDDNDGEYETEELEGDHDQEEASDIEEETTNKDMFAFKKGDESYEIPKDATFKVLVDGEEQEVSVQEIANGISGQKAISQKFTALDKEKKEFENRLSNYNEAESKVRELMTKGNVVEGMKVIFENAGFSPELAFSQLFEEISPVLDKYADLSPEERNSWRAELQNKRVQHQAKVAQDEVKRLQAEKDQEIRVRQVQQQHNLDDATFMDLYYKLEGEMSNGSIQQQPITPELVGRYAQVVQQENWVSDALQGTELEGNRQAIDHVLVAVNQLAREGTKVDQQYVKDLVAKAYGNPKLDKARKVNQSFKKKGTKPKAQPSQVNKSKGKAVSRKGSQGDRALHWMEALEAQIGQGKDIEELGLLKSEKRQQKNKRRY